MALCVWRQLAAIPWIFPGLSPKGSGIWAPPNRLAVSLGRYGIWALCVRAAGRQDVCPPKQAPSTAAAGTAALPPERKG